MTKGLIWRAALLSAGVAAAAGGCARSDLGEAGLEIESIELSGGPIEPGAVRDATLWVRNHTPTLLFVARAELRSETSAPGFSTMARADNPDRIAATERAAFLFRVTLPATIEGLVILGEVAAIDEEALKVYRDDGSGAPWAPADGGSNGSYATDLVVSVTTADSDSQAEIDTVTAAGGAGDLSLHEAVAIANNRPGPDLIQFDLGIFSPTARGVITYDPQLFPLVITDADTEIDATGSGVYIESRAVAAGPASIAIGTGAHRVTLRGLAIGYRCTAIEVRDADSFLFEDNELSQPQLCSDSSVPAVDIGRATAAQILTSELNGGNSVSLWQSNDALVESTRLAGRLRIEDSEDALVSDVVIAGGADVLSSINTTFDDCRFIEVRKVCLTITQASDYTVVRDSAFNGCGLDGTGGSTSGVSIGGASRFNTLTRSTITRIHTTPIAIAPDSNEGVAPPVVTAVGAAVSGNTGGDSDAAPPGSVVEVFLDDLDEAEIYLGSTTVQADGTWSFTPEEALPSGGVVTATVTTPGLSTSVLAVHQPVP